MTSKKIILSAVFAVAILSLVGCDSESENAIQAIHSGVAWYDSDGDPVSAHGAGILREGDKFYLFGEYKRDGGNAFNGVSCYSSTDLYNWTFENIALPIQDSGRLGPDRVGERPKVMKCPGTGKYVMFLHTDDSRYKDPAVGYATSDSVNGVYTFQGPVLKDGKPIKKWDMGVFQDEDGVGYLVTHSGNLYKLSNDYTEVVETMVEGMTPQCESPVIFKKDGVYFWMGSHLTSWERNDNYYFTATDLKGPWEEKGLFAPKGTLTWNSQSTFVLPIVGSETTTYMYMGDRWAHPYQKSAATYVWQPLVFDGTKIALPEFCQSWQVDVTTGVWSSKSLSGEIVQNSDTNRVQFSGSWVLKGEDTSLSYHRSDSKGDSVSIEFEGKQIAFYGVARPDGGFAKISIENAHGKEVHSNIVEVYCAYSESSMKYLSPVLEPGVYKLTITVLGEHFFWKAKTRDWGSNGDYIAVDKFLITK